MLAGNILAGKLLEKLLKLRLQAAIGAAGDLAPRQYGFRRGTFTIVAVQEVVNAAKSTDQGNHYSRFICLLVTSNVKNAFNSVSWDKALGDTTVQACCQVPRGDARQQSHLWGTLDHSDGRGGQTNIYAE